MANLKYYNTATSQWETLVIGAKGELGPTGPAGPTGPTGASGLESVEVTSPITNSGTSTSAVIGLNQTSLSLDAARVTSGQFVSARMPSGSVVQVVASQTTNTLAGTFGGSTNPTSTSGTLFHSFNFTPKFSNSKLLLQSTNLVMGEQSNIGDEFFMAAFYDTTRVAMVVSTAAYVHFSNNLNLGYYSFNNLFDSWGTSQKTINIRVGSAGTGGSMYANSDGNHNFFGSSNRVMSFTIMEIAQ